MHFDDLVLGNTYMYAVMLLNNCIFFYYETQVVYVQQLIKYIWLEFIKIDNVLIFE